MWWDSGDGAGGDGDHAPSGHLSVALRTPASDLQSHTVFRTLKDTVHLDVSIDSCHSEHVERNLQFLSFFVFYLNYLFSLFL